MYRGMITGKLSLDRLAKRMKDFLVLREEDVKDLEIFKKEYDEAGEDFQREIIMSKIKMVESRIKAIDKEVKEYKKLLKYHK